MMTKSNFVRENVCRLQIWSLYIIFECYLSSELYSSRGSNIKEVNYIVHVKDIVHWRSNI